MKRTIYADRDGMISQLQNAQQAALGNKDLAGMPKYRRMWWGGRAEGIGFAIALLRDWAGEEEPEPDGPVTCVCGYGPTTEEDFDQHVLASMHLPGDHIARR